jgi:Scaffold protein Nfu/NifU N terminal
MASVVDVSPTPNPDAMKFTIDVRFDEMFTVSSPEAAPEASPVAAAIFDGAPGVASVFGTADFITVTRAGGASWDDIESAVRAAVAEHL